MESRYRVIISGRNIYKEVELNETDNEVRIGTGMDCEVRLGRDLFFGQIELDFTRNEETWSVACSDNLYLSVGDVRKLMTKALKHGDMLQVKYQDSDNDVFTLAFMLDFDYEQKDYNTEIDITGKSQVVIGGAKNADIYLEDSYVGKDTLILKNENGKITIADENSRYGIYVNGVRINNQKLLHDQDFFSIASFSFYYKEGKLYTSAGENIFIHGLTSQLVEQQSTHYTYPQFFRNTRVQYNIPEGEIEIQRPSPKPQKPKKNLLISIIPSICMLLLMVVLRGFMGSGGMFVIYSVCSMGIGIVMSVITYQLDGKEYKKNVQQREEEYRAYIARKEEGIEASRENELRIRNLIFESLSNSIQEVQNFGKRIFEKSVGDKDFLEIYLGTGDVETTVPVKYDKQEFVDTGDPISQLPEEVEKAHRYIADAPIVSNFNGSNAVGVVGNRNALHEIMKNMTLDLAIRHFYKEVKLFYMFDESDSNALQWVRWLRHVQNDDIGIRNFMCDEESRKILLENLYTILSSRETARKENERQDVVFETYYVVFVLDSSNIRNHPVSKYIENCNMYGFTFVFFEEYEEFLPKGCTEIIRLEENSNSGIILNSSDGDKQSVFAFAPVTDELAESVALKLGSISVNEVSLESELTKNITMFELLKIFSVDDLDLAARWAKSEVYRSMAAPLGVKTKNEIVSLDISDKANAHGPHGLVAGTTGSGKSEILQTYVLSMATLFHPYDVGFVIIDFKGGGMANQFKDLPHMMGAITNIDGHEINRSLQSIKAELVKRQAFFAEAGVNHINDYIKLYKNHKVTQPLPHLIIIVDEFAELKAEYPDFMKELISAARIGRTLGVHLILATQKPAGVVDAQIWSNSKFRLCLKVQTKEDSNEVIKTPLAAEIVEAGRAYFQVGNNEIFELFQSGFSGAKVPEGGEKYRVYAINELNSWGKKKQIYTNKRDSGKQNSKNQLQALVEYINNYAQSAHIEKLDGICLPPLEDVLYRDMLPKFSPAGMDIVVPVGFFDDPERQLQDSYFVNLSTNNTYIIGSSMMGKTTLLQTMLLQLIKYYTPKEVQAYIIDCGNIALKSFESSKMVGGVVLPAEEERVTNLFKMLAAMCKERKQAFAAKGLGTYKAYLEAGYTEFAQIVLMIDNIAVFKEYYENYNDELQTLSREGQSLGISIVATGSQTNAMNYRIISNFGERIAFTCNDTGEYANLFDRCRVEPKNVPGRALCQIEKRIVECQIVLSVTGEKEIERVQQIKQIIASSNKTFSSAAKPIPFVPELLTKAAVIQENPEIYLQPYRVPVGMDFDTVEYVRIDLCKVGYFGITGKEKSGKTNLVRNILCAIQDNVFDSYTRAFVFDDSRMTLDFCQDFGFVEKYELDEAELGDTLDLIVEEMHTRMEKMREGKKGMQNPLAEEPLLLLVIENRRLLEGMGKTSKELEKLKEILGGLSELKICVIFSNLENVTVGFNTPEIYKLVKNNKKLFLFEDASEIKFVDLNVKQQKANAKPLRIGDAFMSFDNQFNRIRTILSE